MTTTVFHTAAKTNYTRLLHIATTDECNAKDQFGMTPILWATSYGHSEALSVLHLNGGNLDEHDSRGNTALHIAVAKGDMKCLNLLLGFGVNPYYMNVEGLTPQQLAASMNHENKEAILKLLYNWIGVFETFQSDTARSFKETAKKDYEKLQKKFTEGLEKEDHADEEEDSTMTKTQ